MIHKNVRWKKSGMERKKGTGSGISFRSLQNLGGVIPRKNMGYRVWMKL